MNLIKQFWRMTKRDWKFDEEYGGLPAIRCLIVFTYTILIAAIPILLWLVL